RVRASARFFKVWPLALPYALLAFPNYHQTSIRSRNRTADHQQVIININLCDRKAFDRYPVVAHVARRTRALNDTRRISRLADRTGPANVHRAVRFRPACKVMALDRTRKAASFRAPNDLDLVPIRKNIDLDLIADRCFRSIVKADLFEDARRRYAAARDLEVSAKR